MSVTREVVNRCLALIPLIREHQGISLDELARLARLPKEQIADELGAVLLMCGVPPYFPHDYIGFYLDGDRVQIRFADQFRRPISLSPLEALALKIACESLAPPGRGIPRVVANLLRKVESAMAPDQRTRFRNLARRVTVSESEMAAKGTTARLAMAVAERRALSLGYQAPGRHEARTRRVMPYGLLSRDGHWYLVGHDSVRDAVVTFRLDRLQSITVLDERFEIPPGFRLDDYARGPLVSVEEGGPRARIRFRGPSARWVRETAATGAVEDEEDGAVTWSQPVANGGPLGQFILGFRGDAEVLEPESLRQRVRKSLGRVAAAHAG